MNKFADSKFWEATIIPQAKPKCCLAWNRVWDKSWLWVIPMTLKRTHRNSEMHYKTTFAWKCHEIIYAIHHIEISSIIVRIRRWLWKIGTPDPKASNNDKLQSAKQNVTYRSPADHVIYAGIQMLWSRRSRPFSLCRRFRWGKRPCTRLPAPPEATCHPNEATHGQQNHIYITTHKRGKCWAHKGKLQVVHCCGFHSIWRTGDFSTGFLGLVNAY